jgi:hypothetical protein
MHLGTFLQKERSGVHAAVTDCFMKRRVAEIISHVKWQTGGEEPLNQTAVIESRSQMERRRSTVALRVKVAPTLEQCPRHI